MYAPVLSMLTRWRFTVAGAAFLRRRAFDAQAERERGRIPHESIARMRSHFWLRFAEREMRRADHESRPVARALSVFVLAIALGFVGCTTTPSPSGGVHTNPPVDAQGDGGLRLLP